MIMKSLLLPVLFLLLSGAVFSQDYSRLENVADSIKDQAESLSKTTERALDRGRSNSTEALEQAFLAEQVTASSKLLEKLIKDRFGLGDLRLAGNVLSEMAENFPVRGANGSQWARLKDTVDAMMFELRRDPNAPSGNPSGGNPDADNILGKFFWNGEVDATVELQVTGTRITPRTLSGRTLEPGAYSFTSALPEQAGITVGVIKRDGRGIVSVVQQPNAGNNYTAVIRIVDESGGADSYSLEIYWY